MDALSAGEIAELKKRGYGIIPPELYTSDMEPEFLEIWEQAAPFTMTSLERGYALFKSIEYIVAAGLEGDIVECGVWKGGSCMIMALSLQYFSDTVRPGIYLYDTFEGMPEPGREDIIAWNGRSVYPKWKADQEGSAHYFTSWSAGMEEVRRNMRTTAYPEELTHYVPGRVEETLKRAVPDAVALLRLDTDWYESTRCELEQLYPRLRSGGILVIDDYGHFLGARKAVDQYFRSAPVMLSRIDYTGRLLVKP